MTANEYKEARKQYGANQVVMAALLGVTRETISRREQGKAEITKEAELAMKWMIRPNPVAESIRLKIDSALKDRG